jgi:hypothetical protein
VWYWKTVWITVVLFVLRHPVVILGTMSLQSIGRLMLSSSTNEMNV